MYEQLINRISRVMRLERASGVPDTPEERAGLAKTVPLRRMSEAEEVANVFVFIASDELNVHDRSDICQ